MQGILIVVLCSVCCKVAAQTANTASVTPGPATKSNWEEFTSSHQTFKESTKTNRNKITCVLNLLKSALAEELQNSYFIADNQRQENISSFNRSIDENQFIENYENQVEKPIMRDDNDVINDNQKEVATKGPIITQNFTEQNYLQIPNMIPIFKARPQPNIKINQNIPRSFPSTRKVTTSKPIAFVPEKIIQTIISPISNQYERNQRIVDSSPTRANTRQLDKLRAVSFVPEKIIQTNLNPIASHTKFNIPCQRAADVLEMNVITPTEADYRNANLSPNVVGAKLNLPTQTTSLPKCVNEDDTVAMLFKPKNISVQQVHGNLRKTTTITVLVPYHMSKLGAKS